MKKKILLSVAAVVGSMMFSSIAHADCNDGENRRVRIINETSGNMVKFYASPPGVETWEDNILSSPIKAYDSRVINFDDGRCRCVYDFRAEFNDRQPTMTYKLNVCTLETYRYH